MTDISAIGPKELNTHPCSIALDSKYPWVLMRYVFVMALLSDAVQDQDGNTALHSAVLTRKNSSISILLEAGADPTLVNFSLYTAIHDAARTDFLP